MSDTEQIPTITTKPKRVYTKRQPVVQVQEVVHETVIELPQQASSPKQKRERSEKQILAFKKMQEKRKEQDELKKLNKTIEKDKQIHDNHSTKIQKLKDKIISNASLVIPDDEDEDDDEPIQPKPVQKKSTAPKEVAIMPTPRKPRTKKPKPVLDDDDDDEEEVHSNQRVSLPIRQVSTQPKYLFL